MKTWWEGTVIWVDNEDGIKLGLETALTPELIEEGRLAEIKRLIQDERKKSGLNPGDVIEEYFYTPRDDLDRSTAHRFADEIKKHCKIKELSIL